MRYLRGTRRMPLTLEADNMHVIKWWVDASFAVHNDMKSHTGTVMSLGKGAAYASSTEQKLNTRNSTEAELVGVNDIMPQVLWTRYFWKHKGITCKIMWSIRTTRARCYWKTMEVPRAANEHDTSTSDIFLLPIGSHRTRCEWNIVPLETCLVTTSPRQCRAVFLKSFETK